jgi:hypothetical protein
MAKYCVGALGWWPAYMLEHQITAAVVSATPGKLRCVCAKITYGVNLDHGMKGTQLKIP